MENSTVADRIRARLDALGKNPSAVALEAGLSRSSVLDILKGKAANPRIDTLQKLVGPLECSLEYLTGGSPKPYDAPPRLDKPITLSEWEPVLPKIEGSVYRDPSSHRQVEQQKHPHSYRKEGWSSATFMMGDESLAGMGIFMGDAVDVLFPPEGEEIALRSGMLILVKHALDAPSLEQLSARVVSPLKGDMIEFTTRPNDPARSSSIRALYDGQETQVLNHLKAVDGGTLEILGIVFKVIRDLPV